MQEICTFEPILSWISIYNLQAIVCRGKCLIRIFYNWSLNRYLFSYHCIESKCSWEKAYIIKVRKRIKRNSKNFIPKYSRGLLGADSQREMSTKDDVERCRTPAGNCREIEARQRVDTRPRDCHYATEPRYLQDLPRSSRPTVTRSEHDGSVGRSRSWSAFTCSLTRRPGKSIAESRSCCDRENESRGIRDNSWL